MAMKIRGDLTTPSITRDFAREMVDIQQDSLLGAFGDAPPVEDIPPELEAAVRRQRQELAVSAMQKQIMQHIRFGKFRIAEHKGDIIGFAMSMPEQLTPYTAVRRNIFRARPVVDLDDLHVRAEFQDARSHKSPGFKLGETALHGYDPNAKIIGHAAIEDPFTPGLLSMLGFSQHPAIQKAETKYTPVEDGYAPMHVVKFEARRMVDQA